MFHCLWKHHSKNENVPYYKRTIHEGNFMFDKRICGASSSHSSLETDGTRISRSKSPLVAIGQDTKYEKSEDKGNGCGSNVPLTNPSNSGPSHKLGTRPKVILSGDKKKLGNKKDNVWHNPTRKSAKSLKGQGQFLATYEEKDDGEDKECLSGLMAVRAHEEGPRCIRHGRGMRAKLRSSTSYDLSNYSCLNLCIFLALAVVIGGPISAVLISFNDIAESGNSDQGSAPVNKSTMSNYCPVIGSLVYLFLAMCIVIVIYVSPNKDKKRKR